MKLLFVGEGSQDIGRPEFAPKPRPAGGVVAVLARRLCPAISADSIALSWRKIPVLDRKKRGKGFAAKVTSAILLAAQQGCAGTVCVVDRDRDDGRLQQMEEGKNRGLELVSGPHAVVCGIARESIEAWTLGAPEAIARVLRADVAQLQVAYKLGDVETFYQHSGKAENRPKDILARVAELGHLEDSTEFRERVAEHTDLDALVQVCPKGFGPFAAELLRAFNS